MPALPSVPSTLRCQLGYTVGADIAAITRFYLHYSSAPPTITDATSLANALGADFNTHLNAFMSSDYALTSGKVTDLNSALGVEVEVPFALSGVRAGHQMAAGVATLINYTISRRYRGGKPRSYFPFGVAEDLGSSDQWNGAYTSAADTAIPAYFAELVAGSYGALVIDNHVNVSYYSGFHTFTTPSGRVKNIPTLRATPVVDIITSATCNIRPGSQRRRNQHGS